MGCPVSEGRVRVAQLTVFDTRVLAGGLCLPVALMERSARIFESLSSEFVGMYRVSDDLLMLRTRRYLA